MENEQNSVESVVPEATEEIINEPSQNPVEAELKREEKRNQGRTEAEKMAFNLQMNADRARKMGLDPAEVLGIKPQSSPEGTVVTLEMLEERERAKGQKTALQLADELPDEHERNLAKKYLLEKIVPSGDAHEDLRFARLAINSLKNSTILEEVGRKGTPSRHSSSAGAPAKKVEKVPELTADEQAMLQVKGRNGEPILTREEIIAARQK